MRSISFLLLLLLVSCKNGTERDAAPDKQSNAASIAELEVYDFKGLQNQLSTTSDTTYVVNFWATWCAPCVKELPYFEQLSANYSSKNVKVILVSLDFSNQYDTSLKPFIKAHQLKSKVVALNDPDSNSWIPKVNQDWSGTIPATLIFTKDKRRFFEKSFTYDELETEVKQIIN